MIKTKIQNETTSASIKTENETARRFTENVMKEQDLNVLLSDAFRLKHEYRNTLVQIEHMLCDSFEKIPQPTTNELRLQTLYLSGIHVNRLVKDLDASVIPDDVIKNCRE